MERLKLMALDEADLAIVSACLQDAVFKVSDLSYDGASKVFSLEANRFVWEEVGSDRKKRTEGGDWERRRAVLAIKRVQAVKSRGFDRKNPDEVLSLLALRFVPGDEVPSGQIELVLSGGGAIIVAVECIELQLSDVSGSWGTEFKPRHPLG